MSLRTAASLIPLAAGIFLFAGCDLVGADANLEVVQYNGPAFTRMDARHIWTAEIEGDEVTLQAIRTDTLHGPHQTLFLTLEHRPNALPKIRDSWYGPYGGGLGDQVRGGTVEIKTWEIDELISGAVDLKLPKGGIMYDWFYIHPADTDSLTGR